MSSKRQRAGFTLIEVMIAAAIVAMVTTLCWGAFRDTFRTKAAIEAGGQRYRSVRLGLERMEKDLSMAFLSQNEDTSQPERRTLFIAKHAGQFYELRFSYLGHQRLYQDANEADTAQVQYIVLPDLVDRRKNNLIRRETRRLQYTKFDDGFPEGDIVCDDIVKMTLEFRDPRDPGDKKWREEWVTTSADGQPDRLPSRVRITLVVRDERGIEIPFVTEARISILEPLNSRAVDIPPPPVGGAGGSGGTGGTAGSGGTGGAAGSGGTRLPT